MATVVATLNRKLSLMRANQGGSQMLTAKVEGMYLNVPL